MYCSYFETSAGHKSDAAQPPRLQSKCSGTTYVAPTTKKGPPKEEQPKNPELSARFQLIGKESSRNVSEGAEAWSLELRVPHKTDSQKSPKSWKPGCRVQPAARTTKKLSTHICI